MPMPIRSGQLDLAVDAFVGFEHFAGRRDRVVRRVGRIERRAEQRQKSVAEKLVHDAAMAIEDVDQHRERPVEAIHHFPRCAGAGAGRKAAEIDEHHRDPANFALGALALRHQPLDHLRRDVLAKQIGDAVARGRSENAGLELAAQLHPHRARQHAANQDDDAADDMEGKVRRGLVGELRRAIQHRHGEQLGRRDEAGEGGKPEIKPQRRENDEDEIGQRHHRRPGPAPAPSPSSAEYSATVGRLVSIRTPR